MLCRSNVAKSLIVPTHTSPPYFYIQQPLKHVNLILSKLSFLKGCKNRNSFKRIICFYLIKDSIFYEIIITVFQFTQRAIENRSMCHAWHACRRLPTPVLEHRVKFLPILEFKIKTVCQVLSHCFQDELCLFFNRIR